MAAFLGTASSVLFLLLILTGIIGIVTPGPVRRAIELFVYPALFIAAPVTLLAAAHLAVKEGLPATQFAIKETGSLVELVGISPFLIGLIAMLLAARARRLRWLIHMVTALAMVLAGPIIYFSQTPPLAAGEEPGPGEGFIVVLLLGYLAVALVLYLIFIAIAWLSGKDEIRPGSIATTMRPMS